MNINIPDKIYKLLTLIGLILIGYSFYNIEFAEKKYFSEIDNHRSLKDSLLITDMILNNEKQNLINISKSLSKKYDIENPLTYSDSTISFIRVLSGPKDKLKTSDSINKLWDKYFKDSFKRDLLDKKLIFSSRHLDQEENLKKSYFENYKQIQSVGFVMFFLGIFIWAIEVPFLKKESVVIKRQEILYTYCQSCGEKFNSMLKYGTNKDKSENYAFCKKCYKKGKFTQPNLTKEELIKYVSQNNKNKPWIIRRILRNRINDLERWDSN